MTIDHYNPACDVTPACLERVAAWIRTNGEVLVVLRYLRAAGSKDFALCHTQEEFESLVNSAPRGTDINVFRDRQLPLRGIVDRAFIESALQLISAGDEYPLMLAETEPGTCISRVGRIGASHAELHEDLAEVIGAEVALGRCPDWCCPDNDALVSAAKGGIDGPR